MNRRELTEQEIVLILRALNIAARFWHSQQEILTDDFVIKDLLLESLSMTKKLEQILAVRDSKLIIEYP